MRIASLAAATTLLVGCTSTTEVAPATTTPTSTPTQSRQVEVAPSPSPLDYIVTEKAIWPRSDDYYDFVVVISNPNTEFAWDSAYVDIDGLADDGSILDSDWDSVTILPGRSVVIYGSLFTDGRAPVELEVRGLGEPIFIGNSKYCELEFQRISVAPSYGDSWVEGYVSSDCDSELTDIGVQALVRDLDGLLIFGGETHVSIVKPETESFVDVLLWDVTIPSSASVELVSDLGFFPEAKPSA